MRQLQSTPAPAAQPTAAVKPTEAPKATEAPKPTEPPAPTAAPAERPGSKSKDPTTFVFQTFGDPTTFDPHIIYDTASSGLDQNIHENLIWFDGADPNAFKPVLAEAIPDPVTNADGSVTYVWKIKPGVKFQDGGDLTATDVAYSFWRSMLLGDPTTPAFLLLQSFFGSNVNDATQILIDPEGNIAGIPDDVKAANAGQLAETCELVKAVVVPDDAAGTVTMNLPKPWGPFMATLAGGGWAAVVDQQYQVANSDWDGDCATWQNFYGVPPESGLFLNKANGTGPYSLDQWTPGEQIVLKSNPNYWGGEPPIKTVIIKNVVEFGTRFAALQAGDADKIQTGSSADYVQMDTLVGEECDLETNECTATNPDGILRKYPGLLNLSRTDIYFNFKVDENSQYIGSGKLDGQGIPPDFFNDVHIRKAFAYCFDYETYIQDVQLGLGQKSLAITLPGELGYDGTPEYTYDLAKCEEEFKASTWTAEDGTSLWDTGFYLQTLYNAGNTGRQAIAEILAASLQQVNPKFFISPVALPWPVYLRSLNAKQLPLATSGWQEDIHDPHNWYVPYLQQTYASRFSVPQELRDRYDPLIEAGVYETDPAKRAAIYLETQSVIHEDSPLIIGSVPTSNVYEPLYLKGWQGGQNRNPLVSPYWYADFSKD